jgi:hypothetical protein
MEGDRQASELVGNGKKKNNNTDFNRITMMTDRQLRMFKIWVDRQMKQADWVKRRWRFERYD